MSVRYVECRKGKKWEVTWRNPWTGKRHSRRFAEEVVAVAFDSAQVEIATKEKALLRKARKPKANQARIKVKDLLESYFRLAHSNPVTIKQSQYHASHISSIFGHRQASHLDWRIQLASATSCAPGDKIQRRLQSEPPYSRYAQKLIFCEPVLLHYGILFSF